jgi:hypothetical protein
MPVGTSFLVALQRMARTRDTKELRNLIEEGEELK